MLGRISDWVLPISVGFAVILGALGRVRVFDCFKAGVLKGIRSFYGIMPTVIGLVVAVTMLRESGAMTVIETAFSGAAEFLGVPSEIIPVALLTPLSGSGSLSVFEGVLKDYGPDSFIGQVASVLMGATDTTFYAVSVYFSAVGIKNTRHTLLAGLSADFTSLVLSSLFVRLTL